MKIDVLPASRDQLPVLANLLELYAHDFNEYERRPLRPDGRFGYPHLAEYWKDPARYPFLFEVDGKIAGFALISRGSGVSGDEEVWDVTEFFVARGFRRMGVGEQATATLWSRFPGRWEVRVLEVNTPAVDFWARVVAKFCTTAARSRFVGSGDRHFLLFSFLSDQGVSI